MPGNRQGRGLIDWQQDAAQLSRQVRAFNPWPIAETRLNGAQLRIWDAEPRLARAARRRDRGRAPGTVLAAGHDGIDVACGGGGAANSAPAAGGP